MKHSLWLMKLVWPNYSSMLGNWRAVKPSIQRVCCKNQPPQQRQRSAGRNDTLWISVAHLFPPSASFHLCQRFSKTNISKTDSYAMALCLLPVQNQQMTYDMRFTFNTQSRQTAEYICYWCFDTFWPAKSHSVTVISRRNVHKDRSQIKLRVSLNDSFLPFQALLWEHRWLALCLKPALPGTGTSASSWLCTLLHSDDFFQVLPSSLFWLVYALACLVSSPCLQPPGKEGYSKDPVLQR